MLRQKVNNGISLFMQKMGTGYAQYFNKKYERVGPLFQGKYKIEAIKNESHLIHLPYYIHANPLDLTMPGWRERELASHKRALQFLEGYRWSSFPDYIGMHNFPSVTQREFLLEFAGGAKNYRARFTSWLKEMNLEEIAHLTLES
jgi:putative transposase